nr:XdhC family protein [Paenibacillus alkalitolerans]
MLATIVNAEGHSYRKAAACLLFRDDGERLGSISPGCLESDLQLRVADILTRGKFEIVEYDMRSTEDFSWGEAVGCGGKIRVLLEPVEGFLRDILCEIHDRTSNGESLRLHRWLERGAVRYRLVFGHNSRKSAVMYGDGGRPLLIETEYSPRQRLIIFGAGLDAQPIASLAGRLGFQVAVADWREDLCTNERFPGAQLAVGQADDAVRSLRIGRKDYVLVCSHHFRRDKQWLEAVIPMAPAYIGIIGSQSRIRSLLDGIERPPSLHAPAGLPIGADGPEQIAVSIVAELIQIARRDAPETWRGEIRNVGGRYLFGGGTEQADGDAEAVSGAVFG